MRSIFRCASLFCLLALLMLVCRARAGEQTKSSSRSHSEIRIDDIPARPFIEVLHGQQLVNFDLVLSNDSQKTYRLVAIKLSVFDQNNRLEAERELNENGFPSALTMVGERQIRPGAVLDVFQPFFSFGAEIELARMHFDFLFMEEEHRPTRAAVSGDRVASIDVRPKAFHPAPFCLPIAGLLLVHDGHDFYSHHRRYNLVRRYEANPETAVSANLYAYDLMKATDTGLLFKGDANRKENWLSYGAPIFAPAAGVVIEAVADVEENTFTADGEAKTPAVAGVKDPLGFGNHVKIKHADGRVSWLLHMEPGSIPVRAGDRVVAGQLIGKVGFSGDSLFPHLHYNVTAGSDYPSQGVPSYFKDFIRVLGRRRILVSAGGIDTGELVERTDALCR